MTSLQFDKEVEQFRSRLKVKHQNFWDLAVDEAVEQFGKTESALNEAVKWFENACAYNFTYC